MPPLEPISKPLAGLSSARPAEAGLLAAWVSEGYRGGETRSQVWDAVQPSFDAVLGHFNDVLTPNRAISTLIHAVLTLLGQVQDAFTTNWSIELPQFLVPSKYQALLWPHFNPILTPF